MALCSIAGTDLLELFQSFAFGFFYCPPYKEKPEYTDAGVYVKRFFLQSFKQNRKRKDEYKIC